MKEKKTLNNWKTYLKLFFSWLLYVILLYLFFFGIREAYFKEQEMKKETIENNKDV